MGFKDSMEATDTGGDINLDGYNFGVSGFFNYSFHKNFSFRVEGGYNRFNLEAENKEDNTKVHYAQLGLTTMFTFPVSQFRTWIGTHGYVYFPFSKETTVIDETTISSTIVYGFSAGVDIALPGKKNGQFMIPIAFDYSVFPSSNTVKSQRLTLKAGFAMRF